MYIFNVKSAIQHFNCVNLMDKTLNKLINIFSFSSDKFFISLGHMSTIENNYTIEMNNKDKIDSEIDELISLKVPVVLFGDVGKTFYLKNKFKNSIVIDSREIGDFKNLSGYYAFKFGEIEYNNGVLIDAMKLGKTLIIKRIDLNLNLIYFLYSVIKYRTITNSLGEHFTAHKDFNLVFTSKDVFEVDDVKFVGPLCFSYEKIIENLKDTVKVCVKNLISYVSKNKASHCLYSDQKRCGSICLLRNSECLNDGSICFESKMLCNIHFRDINQFISVIYKIDKLNFDNRMIIYENFCNIFLRHDSEEVLTLLHLNQPPQPVLFEEGVARTYPFCLGVRNLMLNIKNRRHTLLIGETGAGKTSVVQYLARNANKHFGLTTSLKIINMSSDFDGSDLVGGYCTLDIKKCIRDIYEKYKLVKPNTLDNFVLVNNLKIHLLQLPEDKRVNFEKEIVEIEQCLEKKVNIIYQEGLLIESMKEGSWVLLDEINLCNDETMNLIEALVSKGKITHFDSDDQVETHIHPNFRLFACMNPHGDHGKKKFDSYYFNHIFFYDFSADIEDINLVTSTQLDCQYIGEYFHKLKSKIHSRDLVNRIEPLLTGRTLVRALQSMKAHPEVDKSEILMCLFMTQFNLQSKIIARNLMADYFHVKKHTLKKSFVDLDFILTPKVQMQLQDISMSVKLNYPILIQGDTSTGKTSIIYYLASKMNKNVLRINNHEHTESSDYLGTYVTTQNGIEFKESAFIKAIRKGGWVILDELNLAPSDVLEILNRLLDDNREIFVPQLNEVVQPHSEFRLFATQNLEYGGRKGLSKAFRNRFVEIFFEEKEEKEVLEILHLKTGLPMSFCKKMVSVYTHLKHQRNVNYFMTLRDLFRWANRVPRSIYEVFETGMSILYERQRSQMDRDTVLGVFGSVFSDCEEIKKFDFVYKENASFDLTGIRSDNMGIIITKSVKKLLTLLLAAIKCNETALIVGETGIGKTKVVNVISESIGNKLSTLNMHSGSESSDFIGSFTLKNGVIGWRNGRLVDAMIRGESFLIDEINLAEDSVLERLNSLFESRSEIFITEVEKNVRAHKNFRLFATMNPGNDFGKRELSPALRNRFTEIFYELDNCEITEIFREILKSKMSSSLLCKISKNVHLGKSFRSYEAFSEFIDVAVSKNSPLVKIKETITEDEIIDQALALVGLKKDENIQVEENNTILSVNPFYVNVDLNSVSSFNFTTETTRTNLLRIFRAMILKKGILLEGEPGVGKTSIVSNLAKILSKKCVRINLSEQTELSDLVGTYIPTERGVEFIPSEMTQALANGDFIILDEINLCTQSVIEGLNSALDFRRTLFLPELTVAVHPETKIFATMNPCNNSNGRKILPRSFRDRFVGIYMAPYTEEDIRSILARGFRSSKYFTNCSLRENLRRNILGDYSDDYPKQYEISKTSISIGCLHDYPIERIPTGYTIIHSQIKSLEKCLISILKNLPVILSLGIGKNAMIKFICQILNLEIYDFICHKDIDTSDLLGQYHKADNGEFEWMDSGLVESLKKGKAIVLHNPELVEKSIFDRLNSVFESKKVLNVYEKGIYGNIKVHPNTRLILISCNPCLLSPALLDRCVNIELSSELNSVDLWKIFCQSPSNYNEESFIENELIIDDKNIAKRTKNNINLRFENWKVKEITDLKDLEMHLRRQNVLGIRPAILKQTYNGVFNTLIEEEIDAFFEYTPSKNLFDENKIKHINSYRKFVFDIPRGKTEKEKLINIESCSGHESTRRSLMFLKNVWSLNKGATPRTLQNFKKSILKSFKDLSFKDYERIQEISEGISRVDFEVSLEFDMTYFEMLMNIDEDPLLVYKNHLQYEKTRQEDVCRIKIYKELKNIYKYGEGKVEHLLAELGSITRKYEEEINQIEAKLPRDYSMFKTRLIQVDFESYKASEEIQLFFDDFSDVFDYFLLYLTQYDVNFDTNSNILPYRDYLQRLLSVNHANKIDVLSRNYSYESLCAYLLSTKNIEILRKVDVGILGHNLCSLSYGFLIGSNSILPVSLVLEALNSEHCFELDEITGYEFDASLLNECLRTTFKPKKVGYLIERRNEVCVDNSIGKSPLIESLPITSTPMQILKKLENDLSGSTNLMNLNEQTDDILQMNEYSNTLDNEQTSIYKSIKSLRDELTKYFKNSLSCTWLPNYTYFPYLFSVGLVDGERFFFDSLVYEFYDKISIAENYALRIPDNFFYNTVLQYKAFEIEKAVEKKIKDSQSKIRKDPKLFKKIHEDLMSYLGLPVTKILEITFEKPSCHCGGEVEKGQSFSFLINQNNNKESCFCEKWLSLADNFERKNIERQLNHIEETNRLDIVSSFYARNPETKFSYEEICLSKVINRLTDDPTHLKLVNAAFKNSSPAFLFFVFQFAEEKVEYEDGTGIKGGTGEKNISDQIKEEEEISDEYNEENGKEEEEGVDFENQGDISTCSEYEASEVGVEESKDNDGDEEGVNEEDKSNDKESNEEDLDNNNEELVDDNEQINLINDEDAIEDSEDGHIDEDDGKEEVHDESNDKEMEDINPRGFENEYIYKEQQLNQNQTADKAEDYDRKVFGENQTEEALCEGDGDQQAQGNEETGEAFGIEPTINFKYKDEASTNLTLLLRSIFEANSANKYKGDFKSGRKLNMKKIIPYIASDYRRDKIWMKRRKSDKKDYTVRLFVDNSKSMYSQAMIDTLFVTFSRLTNAFKALGIPVEIYRFGSDLVECTLQEMNFSDSETNIEWIDQFRDGINIILTDGVFQKTSFYNENFLVILIDRSGIKKMSKISLCDGNIFVQKYLDQFQLKYCTIENVEELEGVFILALSELIKNK